MIDKTQFLTFEQLAEKYKPEKEETGKIFTDGPSVSERIAARKRNSAFSKYFTAHLFKLLAAQRDGEDTSKLREEGIAILERDKPDPPKHPLVVREAVPGSNGEKWYRGLR